MVILPLRKEIKLDLEELEAKIGTAQMTLGITPRLRCGWQCTARDLELRISKMRQALMKGKTQDENI